MARSNNDSPAEPAVRSSAKKLTVKQEREARRVAKVQQFKKEQARTKRNRTIAIALSSAAAVAAVALLVTVVVSNSAPARTADSIDIADVKTWDSLEYVHTEDPVDYKALYDMDPPAGGSHSAAWLNCGIYTEPVPNENAAHSLEHGAVWITYDADKLSEADVETLRSESPSSYAIVSPYSGLQAPVVASAWGAQVELNGVDDTRLADFVEKYWQSPTVPEPGSACTGAIDGPGKIG